MGEAKRVVHDSAGYIIPDVSMPVLVRDGSGNASHRDIGRVSLTARSDGIELVIHADADAEELMERSCQAAIAMDNFRVVDELLAAVIATTKQSSTSVVGLSRDEKAELRRRLLDATNLTKRAEPVDVKLMLSDECYKVITGDADINADAFHRSADAFERSIDAFRLTPKNRLAIDKTGIERGRTKSEVWISIPFVVDSTCAEIQWTLLKSSPQDDQEQRISAMMSKISRVGGLAVHTCLVAETAKLYSLPESRNVNVNAGIDHPDQDNTADLVRLAGAVWRLQMIVRTLRIDREQASKHELIETTETLREHAQLCHQMESRSSNLYRRFGSDSRARDLARVGAVRHIRARVRASSLLAQVRNGSTRATGDCRGIVLHLLKHDRCHMWLRCIPSTHRILGVRPNNRTIGAGDVALRRPRDRGDAGRGRD